MPQDKLELSRIPVHSSIKWNSNVHKGKLEIQFQLDISQCKFEF